jgi:hypothetical protein
MTTVPIRITRFNNKNFTVLPNYARKIFTKKGNMHKNIFNKFFMMKVQRVYCEVGKKFKIKFALILLFRLLTITSESAVVSD